MSQCQFWWTGLLRALPAWTSSYFPRENKRSTGPNICTNQAGARPAGRSVIGRLFNPFFMESRHRRVMKQYLMNCFSQKVWLLQSFSHLTALLLRDAIDAKLQRCKEFGPSVPKPKIVESVCRCQGIQDVLYTWRDFMSIMIFLAVQIYSDADLLSVFLC